MGYSYTRVDGERVEVHVAAAYRRMEAAFKKQFGLDLRVRSGTRTRAEQAALYQGWIERRPGFNLAARPGYSNHEESGPRGPRALDLYDTGADAGVTVIGSRRSDWLAANAPRFGFRNAGHFFSPREGWHYEFEGSLSGAAPASVEEDDMPLSSEDVRRVARAVWTAESSVNGRKWGDMLRTLWNGNRRGVKGHWRHGDNTADYLGRLGRVETLVKAQSAAIGALADAKGADGKEVSKAVTDAVNRALSDVSITLSTESADDGTES